MGVRGRQILIVLSLVSAALSAAAYSPRIQGTVRERQELPMLPVSMPTDLRESEIRYLIPSANSSIRHQSLEALVGSSIEPLDWPALPRVWWKFDTYDSTAKNSYLGFQWSQSKMLGSTKQNYALKYSRNVSLVLVGSIRSKDPAKQLDDVNALGELMVPPLVIEDPASGFLYPNVRDGYPMVGMCVFEISMASEDTKSFSFDILGSGHNEEKTKGFGTPYTLFSNFFQLDTEKPVLTHYLLEHCQKKFETSVRPWAERQFEAAHRAYRTETRSECRRERYGKDRTVDGDKACLEWFEKWPAELRRNTVARCERDTDDLFRCQLRARDAGAVCPMKQESNGFFTAVRHGSNFADFSFPCDEGAKLVCEPAWPQATMKRLEAVNVKMGIQRLQTMGQCRPLE